jgi:hypothetical protein
MKIDIERLKTDRDYWDEVAPKGATYYNGKYSSPWLKDEPPMYYLYDIGEWAEYYLQSYGKTHIQGAIPRPTGSKQPSQKMWDGKSDPSYGDKAMTSGGEVVILGFDSNGGLVSVQYSDQSLSVISLSSLKPVLTREEKLRNDLIDLVNNIPNKVIFDEGAAAIADAIMDKYELVGNVMVSDVLQQWLYNK